MSNQWGISGESAMKDVLLLSILSMIPPLCMRWRQSIMDVYFSSWWAILIATNSIVFSFLIVMSVRFLYFTSVP